MKDMIEDQLIDVGTAEGDDLFFELIEEYPELDDNDYRRGAVFFSLFTNLIQYLYLHGWTEKELVKEIHNHCEIARNMDDESDD